MEGGTALPRHWLLRALDLETSRGLDPAELGRQVLQAFREALEETWTPEADPAPVRARLEAYSVRLRKARPGDAALGSLLERAVSTVGVDREASLAELDRLAGEDSTSEEALLTAGEALFRPGSRVLTLGYSEPLLKLLTRCSDRLEGVTVCEGRPLNAGLRLATSIGDQAIPARLITEAALELFAPECDIAVVAAERVLPDGAAVGAVGTAVLARLCAAHDVPFYVLAARDRWVPEGSELAHFGRERRSPAEVVPQPPAGVQVMNLAYDLTPPNLITGYVTEEGLTTPAQLREPRRSAA
jgi:translation initiation factor 2B subunit (eIF-2B alpha/beta/delta family)